MDEHEAAVMEAESILLLASHRKAYDECLQEMRHNPAQIYSVTGQQLLLLVYLAICFSDEIGHILPSDEEIINNTMPTRTIG